MIHHEVYGISNFARFLRIMRLQFGKINQKFYYTETIIALHINIYFKSAILLLTSLDNRIKLTIIRKLR